MTVGEKNYIPIKQVVCALMFTITQFCSYLLPQKFTIISIKETSPYAIQHSGTLARISKWVTQLQEFEYNVATKHLTRANLENLLTQRVCDRTKKAPKEPKQDIQDTPLKNAYSLHFDDAFKRGLGRALCTYCHHRHSRY